MRGLRGLAAGALTLIAMQALGSGKGPEQGGKLLGWVAGGLRKALSPEVAAIPTAAKSPPAQQAGGKAEPSSATMPRNPSLYA
jgi:hypothetical protein